MPDAPHNRGRDPPTPMIQWLPPFVGAEADRPSAHLQAFTARGRDLYPGRRGCICISDDPASHDKTAGMTTPPRTSWSLLAVMALALATTACKKPADTTNPDDAANDAGGDADSDAGGGGGSSADDDAGPDFLTVDVFEETVQGKSGEVGECLTKAKETKPDLSGKLSFDFTIAGDGTVSDLKLDPASTVKDDALTACVTGKAKTWTFPKTRDGSPMTLPFTFNM